MGHLEKVSAYRAPDYFDKQIDKEMAPADAAWESGLAEIKAATDVAALTKLTGRFAKLRREWVGVANAKSNITQFGRTAYATADNLQRAYRDLVDEVARKVARLSA